jgi:hypothetical protein
MLTRIKKRNAFYTFHYKPRPLAGPACAPDGRPGRQRRRFGQHLGDDRRPRRPGDPGLDRQEQDRQELRRRADRRQDRQRKWINYEIEKAWNDGKGVLGIQIHRLRNIKRLQSPRGRNPFADFVIGTARPPVSDTKAYNPAPHRQR